MGQKEEALRLAVRIPGRGLQRPRRGVRTLEGTAVDKKAIGCNEKLEDLEQ